MGQIDPASRSAFKMAGVAAGIGAGVAGAAGLKKLSDMRTEEYRATKKPKFAVKGDTATGKGGVKLVYDGKNWVAAPKKR